MLRYRVRDRAWRRSGRMARWNSDCRFSPERFQCRRCHQTPGNLCSRRPWQARISRLGAVSRGTTVLDLSRSYRRALSPAQRAWLKAVDERDAVGPQQDPWLHQLVDLGARLSELRHAYVGELHGELKSVLERLAPSLNVAISYDWGGTDNSAEYAKKMSDSFVRDVKFGVTHRGPHRGDLVITVDGHPAADQVSRGQAKLIASAALLAQAQMAGTAHWYQMCVSD